jgi:hypothetical protein
VTFEIEITQDAVTDLDGLRTHENRRVLEELLNEGS